MAVAHSAASESHAASTGSVSQTSFSWTHTQTGTPQGVLVFVHVANSAGNPVSSVTYGSVTLTRVTGGAAIDSAGEAGRTDLFFAGSGLGTGNQTITVNRANTTAIMYASAATVTAATNTNVTGIVLLEGDGTMAQQSVDDGTPGTDSLRYAAAYSGLNAPPTTGANSTSLTSIDFGNYTAAMVRETTAGQGARLVGFTTASDDRAAVHVAVRELAQFNLPADRGDFRLTERNAYRWSDDYTQGTWTKSLITVTPNNTTAPDGTNTASLLLETASGGNHTLQASTTNKCGKVYTVSGYFKNYAGTNTRRVRLQLGSSLEWGTGVDITADLVAGTITRTVGAPLASGIVNVGSGWYRLYVTATYTQTDSGVNAITSNVYLLQGTTGINYTGDTNSGIYVWGMQYEEGALSDYDPSYSIPTNGRLATDLLVQLGIAGETGSFALTGPAATLIEFQPDTLSAETAAFALTGQPADTRHNVVIEGGTGAFSFTGNDATLTEAAASKVLTAETGALTLTGNPASTLVAVQLGGDVGKFFLPERNQRQWSEEFNNAYWTKTNASITPNATTAPDGTLTADALIENTTPSVGHQITRNITYVTGKTYTHSCYFKLYPGPITRYVRLQFGSTTVFGSDVYANINLATGLVANTPGLGATTSVTNAGNGWYRASISLQYTGAGVTSSPGITLINTAGSALYTDADGLSGVYVWGVQWEESASVTDYDPTGPAGATDAALRQQYKLTDEVGAFVFTGQPATLAKGRTITAETGTFTATGQPATLRHSPRIEASTGSFPLSGGAPALLRGRYLSGGSGTFTETGQPATFRRTWAVQAVTGAFSFTGNPAALTELGAYEIDPIVGSFTLAGLPANLAQSQSLPITVGAFAFAGQPATLRQSQALTAEAGSFTTTGEPAALTQGHRLEGGTGAFSFTGQPATLAKQSAKQLTADTGAFSLAGQPAALNWSRLASADRGLFTLAGQPATLRQDWRSTGERGQFLLSGTPAALTVTRNLPGGTGVFTFTGNPAGLADTDELAVTPGIFVLTGFDATLLKTSTARRRNVLIF